MAAVGASVVTLMEHLATSLTPALTCPKKLRRLTTKSPARFHREVKCICPLWALPEAITRLLSRRLFLQVFFLPVPVQRIGDPCQPRPIFYQFHKFKRGEEFDAVGR